MRACLLGLLVCREVVVGWQTGRLAWWRPSCWRAVDEAELTCVGGGAKQS